jgi:hypothetical protein
MDSTVLLHDFDFSHYFSGCGTPAFRRDVRPCDKKEIFETQETFKNFIPDLALCLCHRGWHLLDALSNVMKKYFFLIFFYFMMRTPVAVACPLCKAAVEKMGDVWTSMGFNWSIYMMMAVPYLLVGGFVAVLYFASRKHRTG